MGAQLSNIGLALVRRALEQHVPGGKTPTLLFEALAKLPEGDEIPDTPAAVMGFVRGPLREALAERLGDDAADDAVRAVEVALGTPASRSSSLEIDIDVGVVETSSDWPEVIVDERQNVEDDPFANQRPTLAPAKSTAADKTVRVLVIARTARMAQRIRAAFGGHRVTVSFTGSVEDTTAKLETFSPDIVIVDGQDSARVEPIDLAVRLTSEGSVSLVIVWSSDQPWASAVIRNMDNKGITIAPVPRATGVEPMLDYIRARFS